MSVNTPVKIAHTTWHEQAGRGGCRSSGRPAGVGCGVGGRGRHVMPCARRAPSQPAHPGAVILEPWIPSHTPTHTSASAFDHSPTPAPSLHLGLPRKPGAECARSQPLLPRFPACASAEPVRALRRAGCGRERERFPACQPPHESARRTPELRRAAP
eukprot:352803-Chlamydomonas_euryale.AAC.1